MKLEVSIKEYRNSEYFRQERENLEKTHNLKHKNLIEYLASCQNGALYYIILPWADGGSLRDFWEYEDSSERTPELALWALQQMLGLASALKALHNENCRHGDLKPGNILYFTKGGNGDLVIAGFGVARLHHKDTLSRFGTTTTTRTTQSYEAPEKKLFPNVPRSRRYDLWSIGCVFLEFNIWLLYGFEAIQNFSSARSPPAFSFYKSTHELAEIDPAVSEAIDILRTDTRCRSSTALKTLIDVISNRLLQVEVDRRCMADELYNELHELVQNAITNPSDLRIIPPSDMPRLFQGKRTVGREP